MTRGNAPSRTDANHKEITEALTAVHWPYLDVHASANLCDIITVDVFGQPLFIEFKDPKERNHLTDGEREFMEMVNRVREYYVISCDVEETFAAIGLMGR